MGIHVLESLLSVRNGDHIQESSWEETVQVKVGKLRVVHHVRIVWVLGDETSQEIEHPDDAWTFWHVIPLHRLHYKEDLAVIQLLTCDMQHVVSL